MTLRVKLWCKKSVVQPSLPINEGGPFANYFKIAPLIPLGSSVWLADVLSFVGRDTSMGAKQKELLQSEE